MRPLRILPLLLLVGGLFAAIGTEDYVFENRSVSDILATIAAEADLNIVYAPDLLTSIDGKPLRVSLRLEDVDPADAIQAVLAAAGLRSQRQGGDIIVVLPSLQLLYAELLERLRREHGRHGGG